MLHHQPNRDFSFGVSKIEHGQVNIYQMGVIINQLHDIQQQRGYRVAPFDECKRDYCSRFLSL